jgi:hypothetical protein
MDNYENNNKNRRKKINSLILLTAFTGVMLIVSTYAWFSSQNDVSISGITGSVKVADGLEASLDAESWTNEINLTELLSADGATLQSIAYQNIASASGEGTTISNNNLSPTYLQPVSTTGAVKVYEGNATEKAVNYLQFFKGNASSNSLGTITACKETDYTANSLDEPTYFAFDLFIKDSTSTSAEQNALNLTTSSILRVNDDTSTSENEVVYGLQNSIRMAIVRYSEKGTYSGDQRTIIDETVEPETSVIDEVAIWEPNSNYHVSTIVNTNNKISGVTDTAVGLTSGKFTKSSILKTYTLAKILGQYQASGTRKDIVDVYNYGNEYLSEQKSVKTTISDPTALSTESVTAGKAIEYGGEFFPTSYAIKGVVATTDFSLATETEVNDSDGNAVTAYKDGIPLYTTESNTTDPSDGGLQNRLSVYANAVTRLRVYVWIEGQDVDCTNYASHGNGITIDFGIQKPATTVS